MSRCLNSRALQGGRIFENGKVQNRSVPQKYGSSEVRMTHGIYVSFLFVAYRNFASGLFRFVLIDVSVPEFWLFKSGVWYITISLNKW